MFAYTYQDPGGIPGPRHHLVFYWRERSSEVPFFPAFFAGIFHLFDKERVRAEKNRCAFLLVKGPVFLLISGVCSPELAETRIIRDGWSLLGNFGVGFGGTSLGGFYVVCWIRHYFFLCGEWSCWSSGSFSGPDNIKKRLSNFFLVDESERPWISPNRDVSNFKTRRGFAFSTRSDLGPAAILSGRWTERRGSWSGLQKRFRSRTKNFPNIFI